MFRLNVTVEVVQTANALALQTPVPIQLRFQDGRWAAECESPPVSTPDFASLEEAIITGAEAVEAELQLAVNDRPVTAGRITPADVPAEWF